VYDGHSGPWRNWPATQQSISSINTLYIEFRDKPARTDAEIVAELRKLLGGPTVCAVPIVHDILKGDF
jgi:hypothetical protein